MNPTHAGTGERVLRTVKVTCVLAQLDSWVKIANVSKSSMFEWYIYIVIDSHLKIYSCTLISQLL